jgi:hypothetical protein
VLGSSGELAVADIRNHRVQIFDSEGNYKRQFGTEGKEADSQFYLPSGLASDAHGNLLVTDSTNRLQVSTPRASTSAPAATWEFRRWIRVKVLHGAQMAKLHSQTAMHVRRSCGLRVVYWLVICD